MPSSDDIDAMVDLEYGHPAILPILQILYPNLDYKNSTFHIDHIYPKSKFKKKSTELAEGYSKKANYLYSRSLKTHFQWSLYSTLMASG